MASGVAFNGAAYEIIVAAVFQIHADAGNNLIQIAEPRGQAVFVWRLGLLEGLLYLWGGWWGTGRYRGKLLGALAEQNGRQAGGKKSPHGTTIAHIIKFNKCGAVFSACQWRWLC